MSLSVEPIVFNRCLTVIKSIAGSEINGRLDDLIPFDDNHLHYMNGETEAVIELPPGEHTLQLILGDEEHQPWGEHLVSEQITILVEEPAWGSGPQARD